MWRGPCDSSAQIAGQCDNEVGTATLEDGVTSSGYAYRMNMRPNTYVKVAVSDAEGAALSGYGWDT